MAGVHDEGQVMKAGEDLKEKLAAGKILSNKKRKSIKAENERIRNNYRHQRELDGYAEYSNATLSDFSKSTDSAGEASRVMQSGFLAPSIELNSMSPLQVGVNDLADPADGRNDWWMRSHPTLVMRVEDLTTDVIAETGETIARALIVVAYPYENEEYYDPDIGGGIVRERAFNAIKPGTNSDPACLCFYGDTELSDLQDPDDDDEVLMPDEEEGGLGTGTIFDMFWDPVTGDWQGSFAYNEKRETELLLKCENPLTIPMTNFTAHGRLIVMPHPDADYTVFSIYIRHSNGSLVRFTTSYIADRNFLGPTSAVYGSTDLTIAPHSVDGVSYSHTHGGVERDPYKIAAGGGPAIIDIVVKYPLTSTPAGAGFQTTTQAWGTRIR